METLKGFEDFFDRNFTDLANDGEVVAPAMHKRLAAVEMVTDRIVKGSAVSGLNKAQHTGTYAGYQSDDPVQMYDFTVEQYKWTQSVVIPEAVYKYANSPQYLVDQYRERGDLSELGMSFSKQIDDELAGYFNSTNMVSTSAPYATPDGAALCSVAHPINPNLATTYNTNLSTSSGLSYANAESVLQQIGEISDFRNHPAELQQKYQMFMMVCGQQAGLARRIVQTLGVNNSRAGDANSDRNVLPLMGLQSEPIIWSRIGNRYQGANDTTWFIVIPKLSFKVYRSSNIEYKAWIDEDTDALHFGAKAWYRLKLVDWRGVYGATA